MMLEGIRFLVSRGHNIFTWRASSVEVEKSALVCDHNYS